MIDTARYQPDEQYIPRVGPHRYHVVKVVRVQPVHDDYDLVRVACECHRTWRFLHHHGVST